MPVRRRSARLAGPAKIPVAVTATRKLASLDEQEENSEEAAPRHAERLASSPRPQTPSSSTYIKPPMSEMHPSKAHPTMTSAPSSGLRLGFTDIKPAHHTDQSQPSGISQSTPSKAALPSSPFTFRLTRPGVGDMGLSGEAQRMMDELREEAQKIKADLLAKRGQEMIEDEELHGRRIAMPRGRAGRFSAAHMAEFKKMDSIANHPAAFRTQPGRSTPVPTKGIKRSQSRANLDDSEPVTAKHAPPMSLPKKTNLLFNEGNKSITKKKNLLFPDEPISAAKRARQHIDEDASSSRPTSRDGGSLLPRPRTAGKDSSTIPRSLTMASIMTPTKASLARAVVAKGGPPSLIRSPSKPNLGGLSKSVTTGNLQSVVNGDPTPSVVSPGRFDRVKSILRRPRMGSLKGKSALPQPAASTANTPAPPRFEKPLPRVPLTTPRRKLQKRSAFTPDTKLAAVMQNSPSPFKSGIPRSTTRSDMGEVHYPSLETIMADDESGGAVTYPDLSRHRPLPEPPVTQSGKTGPPSVPGTFTFRSDHTIDFGSTSPSGFGSSPGQVSLRHVRPSFMPTAGMPGSFPTSMVATGSDKENDAPATILTAKIHGISNKKRQRISDDEEEAEQEAEERAAKKRKNNEVPEGDALLAPRLTGGNRPPRPGFSSPKKPSQIAGFGGSRTPSPIKKKSMLTMGRLNMLARPKLRK